MTEAILLVGGMGTRLMPLTRSTPKPMLPVAGLPVTEHQLLMAKRAGITSIVLATSYLSEIFIPYFGDGSRWGLDLRYAVEEQPLGTGGAIRNASALLNGDPTVVIFNGDVLTGHDLKKQIDFHASNKAAVTLHLTHVDDARAYGCVPIDANGRVSAFLEKMEKPVTNTINAGCYVFERSVVEFIPENTVVSIEREIFPQLVAQGKNIFGFVDDSYWLDIGTPYALLKGSRDLVAGLLGGPHSEFLAGKGCSIDNDARVIAGSSLGNNVQVGKGSLIDGSILCDGVSVGPGAEIIGSFIAPGTFIESDSKIVDSYCAIDGISPF